MVVALGLCGHRGPRGPPGDPGAGLGGHAAGAALRQPVQPAESLAKPLVLGKCE